MNASKIPPTTSDLNNSTITPNPHLEKIPERKKVRFAGEQNDATPAYGTFGNKTVSTTTPLGKQSPTLKSSKMSSFRIIKPFETIDLSKGGTKEEKESLLPKNSNSRMSEIDKDSDLPDKSNGCCDPCTIS